MKEKLKKIDLSLIANILKASLIGVVTSILFVLIFAFVLKFVDLNSHVISLIDQIIKVISIIISIIALNKFSPENLLVKGLATGAIYAILTFIVFSILNGGFNFSVALLSDIAFSTLVGGVSAVVINMIKKK